MMLLIDGENLREFNGKRNSQKNMVFPPLLPLQLLSSLICVGFFAKANIFF